MAYESYYWRKIIKKEVLYLQKKLLLSHREIEKKIDEHFSYVEIKIMSLAYIARKLADTNKLPDKTLRQKVKLILYPATGDNERLYVDIEREFGLSTPVEAVLSVRNICNQIIHSYVLQVVGNTKYSFRYIWFVSHDHKHKGLYCIKISKFLKIMIGISQSEVGSVVTYFNDNGEKIRINN